MKILVFVALFCSFSLCSCNSNRKDSFNDPIVEINQKSLNGYDFSKKLVRRFVEQDIKYPKDEIINILKKQIVEDFIIQTIFDNYAAEKNILVKKELLDESYNKFVNGYPDENSFNIFLSESGQNKASVRSSIKDQLTRELSVNQILSEQKLEADKKEISEYYSNNKDEFQQKEQINLKQIAFESEEDGIKILELLGKKRNANFEVLATKYSLGPEKVDGGDLGWVDVNSYPPFEEASKSSKGAVTDIIKSENGFHIFKVVDKRSAKNLSLSEVSEKIEKQLISVKREAFLNNWLKTQVKKSKVSINNDLLSKIVVNKPINL